jgi:gluconate kinase
MLKELKGFDIDIKFVVLLADKDELLRRDIQRPIHDQMGERCIVGLNEILESNPPKEHVLDTTIIDVEKVVEEIMLTAKYIIN